MSERTCKPVDTLCYCIVIKLFNFHRKWKRTTSATCCKAFCYTGMHVLTTSVSQFSQSLHFQWIIRSLEIPTLPQWNSSPNHNSKTRSIHITRRRKKKTIKFSSNNSLNAMRSDSTPIKRYRCKVKTKDKKHSTENQINGRKDENRGRGYL